MTTQLIEVDLEALKRTLQTLEHTWYKIDTKFNLNMIVCKGCLQPAFDWEDIKHLDFCGIPDAMDLATRLWEND